MEGWGGTYICNWLVVAKVDGHYRTLASVDRRHLHFADILSICVRLRDIFQAPGNRLALQHELRHARTIDWQDEDLPKKKYKPRDYAFNAEDTALPFILTCLYIGSVYDPFTKRFCNEPVLPFNSKLDYSTCTFFSIIDVTNLEEVSYGFVHWDARRHVPLKPEHGDSNGLKVIPFDAKRFLSTDSTYRGPSLEGEGPESIEKIQEALQNLEKTSLIPRAVVASLWNYKKYDGMDMDDQDEQALLQNMNQKGVRRISTLREIALRKSAEELLYCSTKDFWAHLKTVGKLPDFHFALRSRLYAEPDVMSKSKVVPEMLHEVLRHSPLQGAIDLSPFNLDESQVKYVLFDPVLESSFNILSLSGNRHIDGPFLEKILQAYPSIDTLHLLDTPQINFDIKLALAERYRISQLYDSELLALPFRRICAYSHARENAFTSDLSTTQKTRLLNNIAEDCPSKKPPICYNKPLIEQVICICTGRGQHLPAALASARYPALNKFFAHKSDCGRISLSLEDSNRPKELILSALGQTLAHFEPDPPRNWSKITKTTDFLTSSFATANLENSETVAPLSATFYSKTQEHYLSVGNSHWSENNLDIPKVVGIGKWIFVIIEDERLVNGLVPARSTIRYAFITMEDSDASRRIEMKDQNASNEAETSSTNQATAAAGSTISNPVRTRAPRDAKYDHEREKRYEEYLPHIVIADGPEFLSSLKIEDEALKAKMLESWNKFGIADKGMELCGRPEIESLFRGARW